MKASIAALPRDAWRLARPYFNSERRWYARSRLSAIIALNLLMVGMDVVFNFWNRAFYNSLQDKDWDSFTNLLLTWNTGKSGFLPGFTGLAMIYVLVAVYRTYLNQGLQIDWRRWMTQHMVQDWLSDRAYYRIGLASQASNDAAGTVTDNPDQRIAEDLRDYVTTTLSVSLDLLSNIVTLFSFLTILWTLSGPVTLLGVTIPGFMVWAALVYAIAGTFATHLIGRKLVGLNFRRQRAEADFRFSLARLRENMEGVALYGGEAQEAAALDGKFDAIRSNWWQIMARTKMLNGLVVSYSQLAVIFPIVVAAPRFFAGTLDLGGLTQTAGAFGSVQGAMSWFVTSYQELAGWRATIDRLNGFQAAITEARAAFAAAPALDAAQGGANKAAWRVSNLDLRLPDGRALLSKADLTLESGRSTVITGRSGSGKSTLFRALAGIWPFASGQVAPAEGTALFLPQRPYFPLGSLRDAVCYPAQSQRFSDDAIKSALEAAGLSALTGQLDRVDAWTQRLSGGEQQRLAAARAILIKPDWLFLDEATSNLDPQSEAEVFDALKRLLPSTTLVSIAHRPDLIARHDRHLELDSLSTGESSVRPAA